MGKRSDFERKERDFYPTPVSAVLPLLPHLPVGCSYVEPCAGDGALIRGIGEHAKCVRSSDIEPQDWRIEKRDALDHGYLAQCGADFIVTNPPWDRKVLHPMIEVFSAARPTWLLFDADWMHTKQAAPYMPYLRKVVSVGRVKWIEGSKHTGKDNCCWYLFDQTAQGPAEFVGRAA